MKYFALALTLVALIGCGTKVTTEVKPEGAAATSAEPAAYTNAAGKIVCPVMEKETTKEEAISFQDYEGKRYYFCCGGCPEKFKAEPAKYAKK